MFYCTLLTWNKTLFWNMEIATTCCLVFYYTQFIFRQLDMSCGNVNVARSTLYTLQFITFKHDLKYKLANNNSYLHHGGNCQRTPSWISKWKYWVCMKNITVKLTISAISVSLITFQKSPSHALSLKKSSVHFLLQMYHLYWHTEIIHCPFALKFLIYTMIS